MVPEAACGDRPVSGPVRRGLLLQYRVMAFTTATLLIILVFVGIPLQVAADRPGVVDVVGTMHGFLYIGYLVAAFRLTHKLRVPKWQMALVLLAGTVPFCAFVAERKMSRRFEAVEISPTYKARDRRKSRAASLRRRWLSPRALLLHLEVVIVAPGCAVAGWWQATRALAGNGLSWVYSVEWPLFALLALWGWWHLIHEDPEALKRRKARVTDERSETVPPDVRPGALEADPGKDIDLTTARLARILVALVGFELLLGIAAIVVVPFSRPSGWMPDKGGPIYLAHAFLGALVVVLATVLLFGPRVRTRTAHLVAWLGFAGLALAGAGGVLTEARSAVRFFGMALMLIGAAFAMFAYLIPALLETSHRSATSRGTAVVRR